MKLLTLTPSSTSSTFPAPESIKVSKDVANSLCEQSKKIIENSEMSIISLNLSFDALPLEPETDLMGWDLIEISVNQNGVSLVLEDVNGMSILYQHSE